MNFGGPGLTAQLTATGTYDHRNHPSTNLDITNQVTWKSSVPACVTVTSTGLITSGNGNCTNILVTATAMGFTGLISGSMTVNVTAAPSTNIVSIAVTPLAPIVSSLGETTQFIAIGTTAGGATVDLTNTSAWTSSNVQVATITATTGLATAVGSGSTTVTAVYKNADGTAASGTALLKVTLAGSAEPLASLAIVPASQTLTGVGQTANLLAIATTGSGTTVNLTHTTAKVGADTINAAKWTSSNPQVATIDLDTGIATAVGNGVTAITAIASNPDGSVVTGIATITVSIPITPEPLASLAITPAAQTLTAAGQTANLTAIATTATSTAVNLTDKTALVAGSTIQAAKWYSSNPAVATVDLNKGIATANGIAGVTAITAIAANPDGTVVTGTATITSTATGGPIGTVVSILVIPAAQALASPGQTSQFTAIGTTSTGATSDLTTSVKWSSSSQQIATIGSGTGFATAVGQGLATITALYTDPTSSNVITGTATLSVTGGTTEQYTAVTILPAAQTLGLGQTGQFTALATLGTTGAQVNVTNSPQLKWSSSIPSIATISTYPAVPAGVATGAASGASTITALLTNPDNSVVSATASVTITSQTQPEPLLSLQVIPNVISVGDLQDTGQFLAIGTFSTVPFVRDLTNSPGTTWISSFPDVFPVDTNSGGTSSASAGIVTAYGNGSATIIAEATSLDGTIQTATATFNCTLVLPDINGHPPTPGSCWEGQFGPLKATLTVYGEGLNTTNWLVTAPSATGTPDVIHCGPGWSANGGTGGSVCVAIYPIGTTVTLTAPAQTGVAFGGWTNYCTPTGPVTAAGPNSCTINLGTTNATVGAIFNNQ